MTTSTIPLGAQYPMQMLVRDEDGDLVNASTTTLTIVAPDGSVTNPSFTNSATGTYDYDFTPALAGVYSWYGAATGPVVHTDVERFRVRDLTTDYASLADLKALLGIADTVDDDTLYQALDAAQAHIDSTVRVFTRDAAATARRFGRMAGDLLLVDDICSTSDLAVASSDGDGTYTAMAATSYTYYPVDALQGSPQRPITGIRFLSCPRVDVYGVQVTARWGWPSVPAEVTQATLLLASRLFKRKDSPGGVAGFGDLGVVRILANDVDVQNLLAPFRKQLVG